MACTKLETSRYLNQWSPEFCQYIGSSGLNSGPVNQGESPALTSCWHPETYALSTPSMNHFCLWCSEVNCWQEQIHKFKTEYLLIWQKYLSTWTSIKYFGHQVQVSTKYFWISKLDANYRVLGNYLYLKVQVIAKYSIICIKYQVQVLYLTPTLLRVGMGGWCWVWVVENGYGVGDVGYGWLRIGMGRNP